MKNLLLTLLLIISLNCYNQRFYDRTHPGLTKKLTIYNTTMITGAYLTWHGIDCHKSYISFIGAISVIIANELKYRFKYKSNLQLFYNDKRIGISILIK